jgi:large subunit ribosomal protein L25
MPAVVYGPKQEPISLVISEKTFKKVLSEAGESTIISLTGLTEEVEVLIKAVEFNTMRKQIDHVDLYAIERGKEMTTTIALEFIGEAPVEQSGLGSVTKVLHEVMVTCMPKDLPGHIDVDVSVLVTLEDKIIVSELKIPTGVKLEVEGEGSVAVVTPPTEEKEEEEVVEAVDMDAIEVEQKGKGEEGAEEEKKD